MTPEMVVSLATEAITLTILVSMPILGIGLAVGLIVSVFQAATSVQEMTLTFVPKILAVFFGLIVLAPWMMEKMVTFTEKIINNIPLYIR